MHLALLCHLPTSLFSGEQEHAIYADQDVPFCRLKCTSKWSNKGFIFAVVVSIASLNSDILDPHGQYHYPVFIS
jgi:hypothetical protein